MITLPKSILSRSPVWPASVQPPTTHARYAFPRKDAPGLTLAGSRKIAGIDEKAMSVTAVISTIERDRVGDVVVPEGCDLTSYAANPCVFLGHQAVPLPVGVSEDPATGRLGITIEPGKRILGTCWFHQATREAVQAFDLVRLGVLRGTSIGFNPLAEPVPLPKESGRAGPFIGYRYDRWELLEWSLVGTPANARCTVVRSILSNGRLAGSPISPTLRKQLEPMAEEKPAWSHGWKPGVPVTKASNHVSPHRKTVAKVVAYRPDDLIRWNKSLSDAFDVANMYLPPSSLEYDWVARWIECEVKELFENSTQVPSARMGSFLTGLRHAMSGSDIIDTRNIHGSSEAPPVHETIQLTSTRRDDFLVEGDMFLRMPLCKSVLRLRPTYYGLSVTAWTHRDYREANQKLFSDAWLWAKENNFLKGEAFALSGEFLTRTDEGWDDVFLEEKNKESLSRVIERLNKKQKGFANRGIILTGPPGTGKTLSGRIIRNTAKATFLWVSARDFHRSGSVGGIAFGFEMAKELAPSVLFIEDVDNWLYDTSVDLLKTEMDGISRSTGVLTILTTNFPERLPEALIDRPGRFHDILHFAYPTRVARAKMLAAWLPDVSADCRASAVKRTDGYSGAHLRELADFARVLTEQDELSPKAALEQALRKVEEQRELINQVQLVGSHYRPHKAFTGGRTKSMTAKMNESSGASGGFTIDDATKAIHSAICNCAKEHAEGDDFYYQPDDRHCWQAHGKEADPDALESVRESLTAVDGIDEITQSEDRPPRGKGWRQCHPKELDWLEEKDEAAEVDAEAQDDDVAPAETKAQRVRLSLKTLEMILATMSDVAKARVKKLLPGLEAAGMTKSVALMTAISKAGDMPPSAPAKKPPMADEDASDDVSPPPPVVAESDNRSLADVVADLTRTLTEMQEMVAGNSRPAASVSPDEADDDDDEDDDDDFDFESLDDDDSAKGGIDEEDDEDDEDEDILARYRRAAQPKTKKRTPKSSLVVKRLHKRGKGVIREAADYLTEAADIPHGTGWTRTHAAACKMHAQALDSLHKELEEGGATTGGATMDDGGETPASDDSSDVVTEKEAAAAIQAAFDQAMAPVTDAIYKLTGNKAG